VPDPIFRHPRLAAIYDFIDDDRSDLDAYVAIAEELGARSVLDIGCGTGTLACRLANGGKRVIGVDPASASLDVAQQKAGAEQVRWVHGNVTHLPALSVDLATMTGNVAQVFLTDAEWAEVLAAVRAAVHPRGWLVFETRDPSRRAWESWTRNETYRRVAIPQVGLVDTWIELIQVQLPYVSFRHMFRFRADGTELTSDSTLRFRTRDEVADTLDGAGLAVREVRDAPDRPGCEFVFVAQRLPDGTSRWLVDAAADVRPGPVFDDVEVHHQVERPTGHVVIDQPPERGGIRWSTPWCTWTSSPRPRFAIGASTMVAGRSSGRRSR
jgi:SAM-dependent methyltransferase